jgi:uncharacterized protein (DUF305 family)
VRRSTIIGAVLVGGLALAGCTPSEKPSDAPPAPGTPPPANAQEHGGGHAAAGDEHSSTDREFAQRMLVHHERVVQLAALAGTNSQKNDLKTLAGRIRQEQQPEIDLIKGWLAGAGGQASASAPEDDRNGEPMAPVPAADIAQKLQQVRGADFDRQWIQAMLDLQGAELQISRTQIEEGSAEQMRDLAEKVVATQQADIDEIKKLPPPV